MLVQAARTGAEGIQGPLRNLAEAVSRLEGHVERLGSVTREASSVHAGTAQDLSTLRDALAAMPELVTATREAGEAVRELARLTQEAGGALAAHGQSTHGQLQEAREGLARELASIQQMREELEVHNRQATEAVSYVSRQAVDAADYLRKQLKERD
jgi:ABC-type transporter Mla subunit MlaD